MGIFAGVKPVARRESRRPLRIARARRGVPFDVPEICRQADFPVPRNRFGFKVKGEYPVVGF